MNVNNKSVSVVVPVYNGAETLQELTTRINKSLDLIDYQYELIFINDGSTDRSLKVIQQLAAKHSTIRGFNLMRNYGQHNALFAGIMKSKYSFIVTIDDDLQHLPEEIPSLLKALEQGNDVAYGKPITREHSIQRNVSSKIVKSALRVILGAEMGEYSSAFRAFRSDLKRGFVDFADGCNRSPAPSLSSDREINRIIDGY
jgi:undecaprenyl-phosphate 4-deoxy-4-formamido-L-arabinose transferase